MPQEPLSVLVRLNSIAVALPSPDRFTVVHWFTM